MFTLGLPEPGRWYSREVWFSDWRGVERCDYVTNWMPYAWYSGDRTAKFLRVENMEEIEARLNAGDTLILGMDYYALTSISGPLVKSLLGEMYDAIGGELGRGRVVVLGVRK